MSENSQPGGVLMESAEIQRILPHRYPILLIDRVLEIVPAKRIVAIKNISANEPFFQGHFPGFPIMPGVLAVEAMAQAGAVLLLREVGERGDNLVVFTGIERARFRKPVLPGDQLRIEVDVLAFRRVAGRMQGKAFLGDKLAAEAIISCQLVPAPGSRKPAPSPAEAGGIAQP
jgi:3-hydroxyacyl-[acyl-carrier-protein] dehydratase